MKSVTEELLEVLPNFMARIATYPTKVAAYRALFGELTARVPNLKKLKPYKEDSYLLGYYVFTKGINKAIKNSQSVQSVQSRKIKKDRINITLQNSGHVITLDSSQLPVVIQTLERMENKK